MRTALQSSARFSSAFVKHWSNLDDARCQALQGKRQYGDSPACSLLARSSTEGRLPRLDILYRHRQRSSLARQLSSEQTIPASFACQTFAMVIVIVIAIVIVIVVGVIIVISPHGRTSASVASCCQPRDQETILTQTVGCSLKASWLLSGAFPWLLPVLVVAGFSSLRFTALVSTLPVRVPVLVRILVACSVYCQTCHQRQATQGWGPMQQ